MSVYKWITALVIGICAAPLVLMGVGVDLSSADPIIGNQLHTILEWTAVCTAGMVAILAFIYYAVRKDPVTLIIGLALVAAGSTDAFHTLAADNLLSGESIDNSRFIPFTWAISRVFAAAITMAGVTLLLFRSASVRSGWFLGGVSVFFAAMASSVVLICANVASLPQTSYPDAIITRPWDLAALVLFVIAALFFYPRLHKRYKSVFTYMLMLSAIPDIATQLYMAFGSVQLYDAAFNVAHFTKIVAYTVPLVGLLIDHIRAYKGQQKLYDELRLAHEVLGDHLAELEEVNANIAGKHAITDKVEKTSIEQLDEQLDEQIKALRKKIGK